MERSRIDDTVERLVSAVEQQHGDGAEVRSVLVAFTVSAPGGQEDNVFFQASRGSSVVEILGRAELVKNLVVADATAAVPRS
jgi:hypothetical protein